MQLVQCQSFFHNEGAALIWLDMGVLVSTIAVALMGVAAWAPVDPLRAVDLHLVDVEVLLLLPLACVMVAYGLGIYVWRRRRLYSMKGR